jgi:phosphoribosylformylglycinamidine cyclo-ligase
VAERVIAGIAQGCKRMAGCALIGGETAEMPGMYAAGDYDLAGFCVGAVERGEQLTGDKVAPGHVLAGPCQSSGVHSNGYSLVRRLAADLGWKLDRPALFDQERLLIDALIEPTRIYVAEPAAGDPRWVGSMPALISPAVGLLENVPRVLPQGAHAHASMRTVWLQPRLMAFLQAQGGIEPEEMARTFNCGIGMVLAVRPELAGEVTSQLTEAGETVFAIGTIEDGPRGCNVAGSAGTWGGREAWSASHNA